MTFPVETTTIYSLGLKKEFSMSYVDGYVLAVPKKHLKAYRRMAALGRKAWMKHGAVDYKSARATTSQRSGACRSRA